MLEIINTLKPFFEDNYRRINIREYARLQKISPPTASKILGELHKKQLLKKETDKQYIYYYTNKDSSLFIDFSRVYWKLVLEKFGIINFLEREFLSPITILFGSLSKAEVKKDSDIDLAIFTQTKKELDMKAYEKQLKRKIQLFVFQKTADIKNQNLLNNILNGYRILGEW